MSSKEAKMIDGFEDMNKLEGKFCLGNLKVLIVNKNYFALILVRITQHNYTTAQRMTLTEKFPNMIFALNNEFGCSFTDFQKLGAEFDIVSSPFTTDFKKPPYGIQLELIDLQCDSTLEEKIQS